MRVLSKLHSEIHVFPIDQLEVQNYPLSVQKGREGNRED
jgi:hypothetical protein